MQRAPEIQASQAIIKEKEPQKEEKKRKGVGWLVNREDGRGEDGREGKHTGFQRQRKWCNGGTSIRKKLKTCGGSKGRVQPSEWSIKSRGSRSIKLANKGKVQNDQAIGVERSADSVRGRRNYQAHSQM